MSPGAPFLAATVSYFAFVPFGSVTSFTPPSSSKSLYFVMRSTFVGVSFG